MTNSNKTLKNFLKEHNACKDGYIFAKDLTLEQFLDTCPRGDWILWLFARMNPESLKELTLAKGHCANTVRHLMKDNRSVQAVDAAIKFGEGKICKKELDKAASAAYSIDYTPAYAAASAASAAYYSAASAAYSAAYADADVFAAASAHASAYSAAYSAAASAASAAYSAAYSAARTQHQKKTANICRKYLPIEIWNNI